jgi:hypothetical protein
MNRIREKRLDVNDRRAVHSLQTPHLESTPVDGGDRYAMEPDGVGAMR